MCIATTRTKQQQSPTPPITDRKVIHHATVADGSRIRSRFLDRLGISPSKSRRVAACKPSSSSSTPSNATTNRLVRKRAAQQELLKKDHGEPDESLGPSSYSKTSFSPKTHMRMRKRKDCNSHQLQTKTVSFANAVEVVPIPSRSDYSDRIKNPFWTNSAEMKENYVRNVLEFTAENWDYRQVVEEDQFCVTECGHELVLIHPVHFHLQQQQRERNLRWHSFCAVMSAQQQHHKYPYQEQHHHHHHCQQQVTY